jgi:(p)ppGpp synthase/HD superfamily hydrolase
MPLSGRFEEALIYATQLHAAQVRKARNVPYISHLLGVAAIVLDYDGDEDEAIAALLHDAIEDQGGDATRTEIRRRFGDRVTEIVDGCTDTDVTPKPPWRERKEAYIAHVATASGSIRLVSAADKLYNVRATIRDLREQGEITWRQFKGGRDGTLWYYRSLVDAFERFEPHPLVAELARAVSDLEQVAQG